MNTLIFIHENGLAHAADGDDASGKSYFGFLALFEKCNSFSGGVAAVITLRVWI